MEVEAADEGTLGKILVPEGTEGVKVNTPIAVICPTARTRAALKTAAPAPQAKAAESLPGRGRGKGAAFAGALPRSAATPRAPGEQALEPEVPEGTEMVTMTVREALRDAMAEEMRRDADVFVMGEEVAEYRAPTRSPRACCEEFGARRVIDTPITEHGFAGLGVGAAFAGLKPIVEFMTFNFAMQAMDQLINSAAKTLYMSGGQMGCSIVFRGPNGAAARVAAQHSQDYAWYARAGAEGGCALHCRRCQGPAQIGDPRSQSGRCSWKTKSCTARSFEVPKLDDFVLPIGKARIARPGKDVTIVSWSMGMTYAFKAAEELAERGHQAEIIDLRTMRPLDTETSCTRSRRPNRCVVVEEGWRSRRRLRNARAHDGAGLRLSRCADCARLRQGRADALRSQSREARAAVGRRSRRGGQSRLLPVTRVARSFEVYDELPLPSEALAQGGVEMLRADMVEDELFITARRVFDDPRQWGGLLADVAATARDFVRGGSGHRATRSRCAHQAWF